MQGSHCANPILEGQIHSWIFYANEFMLSKAVSIGVASSSWAKVRTNSIATILAHVYIVKKRYSHLLLALASLSLRHQRRKGYGRWEVCPSQFCSLWEQSKLGVRPNPLELPHAIDYRRAARAWRDQSRAKEAIAVALQDVRQRRATRTMDPSAQW